MQCFGCHVLTVKCLVREFQFFVVVLKSVYRFQGEPTTSATYAQPSGSLTLIEIFFPLFFRERPFCFYGCFYVSILIGTHIDCNFVDEAFINNSDGIFIAYCMYLSEVMKPYTGKGLQ